MRLICLIVAGALVLAAPAAANYDLVGSGTAKVALDPSFRALLAKNGIKLSGRDGAKVTPRLVQLRVSGGEADPTVEQAGYDLEGEVVVSRGGKRLALRKFQVKTKRSPLLAKVGGGQLKLGKTKTVAFSHPGFATSLHARGLTISKKLAVRLDKRLDTDVFAEGQPLGSLQVIANPVAATVLPVGRIHVVPDPAFLAKLKELFVSLNPVAPGELEAGPALSLPLITGGTMAPDGAAGTVRAGGGVELLQLGGGQIFWRELWIGLDNKEGTWEAESLPSPPYAGKQGRVGVFALGGAAFSADPAARTVTAGGVTLVLQPATADQLNQLFAEGRDVFHAGETFGSAAFTAKVQ